MNAFQKRLQEEGLVLVKSRIECLQVNLGGLCNQLCYHCHVDAGPDRQKNMKKTTIEAVLDFLREFNIHTIDITGGAPELNPYFPYLVQKSKEIDCYVIARTNLTVLLDPSREYLPEFMARNRVEIIASLPCYSQENVDQQRGMGVFQKSIRALKRLNQLGYGQKSSGLILNLVYNPGGAFLPPSQTTLEREYKLRLLENFGIVFNRLYTLTNMPINRFNTYLKNNGQYYTYIELLKKNFNPTTLDNLMCRYTLNVGWDGRLYDCDFNQILGLAIGEKATIFHVRLEDVEKGAVITGSHCFGCTAGSGSSCQGALL
jgi:radical SAM/Cys-rich protein